MNDICSDEEEVSGDVFDGHGENDEDVVWQLLVDKQHEQEEVVTSSKTKRHWAPNSMAPHEAFNKQWQDL